MVRKWRYREACRATAELIKRGIPTVSPIVHSHILYDEYGCGGDFETWQEIDLALIEACSEMIVLKLPGWEESRGVLAEAQHATLYGKPIRFLEPTRPVHFVEQEEVPW